MTSVDILKVTDLEFQWTSEFKFYVETSVIVPWVEYAFGYQFPFYSVGNVIAFNIYILNDVRRDLRCCLSLSS